VVSGHRCTRYQQLYDELQSIKADVAEPLGSQVEKPIHKGQLARQTRLITTHLQRCKECS
jgi:hypothetical protein